MLFCFCFKPRFTTEHAENCCFETRLKTKRFKTKQSSSQENNTHRIPYENIQVQNTKRKQNGQNGAQNKLQSAKRLKQKQNTF